MQGYKDPKETYINNGVPRKPAARACAGERCCFTFKTMLCNLSNRGPGVLKAKAAVKHSVDDIWNGLDKIPQTSKLNTGPPATETTVS